MNAHLQQRQQTHSYISNINKMNQEGYKNNMLDQLKVFEYCLEEYVLYIYIYIYIYNIYIYIYKYSLVQLNRTWE